MHNFWEDFMVFFAFGNRQKFSNGLIIMQIAI